MNRNFNINCFSHCLIARVVIYYVIYYVYLITALITIKIQPREENIFNFHSWQVSTMTCCSKPVIVENKMDAVKKNSKPLACYNFHTPQKKKIQLTSLSCYRLSSTCLCVCLCGCMRWRICTQYIYFFPPRS